MRGYSLFFILGGLSMMISWNLHYMEELPDDLKQKFPDYKNRPFVMTCRKKPDKTHYEIYTDNPFIRINPIRYAIQRPEVGLMS